MHISANTILQKMKKEASTLSENDTEINSNYDKVQRIHLLSELWLESCNKEEAQLEKQESKQVGHTMEEMQENSKNINIKREDTSIFDF